MPLPDNEPQYWLRDSNGNLVGAFYLDANGDPAIVDENGNEASLESDGTWDVPAVSTEKLNSTIRFASPGGGDIQTAINEVEALGGGTVYITESGAYQNPLEHPPNVAVKAVAPTGEDSPAGTVLTAQNAAPCWIVRDANGDTSAGTRSQIARGLSLEHVLFDGNGGATSGIRLFGLMRSNLSHVGVTNCAGPSWFLSGEGSPWGGVFYNVITQPIGFDSDRGLKIESNGTEVNANYFYGVQYAYNSKEGLDIEKAETNVIHGAIEQNLTDGTYDPTTRGTNDDPLERVEVAVRDGSTGNYLMLHIEDGDESAYYAGDNCGRNHLFGKVAAASAPVYVFGTVSKANPVHTAYHDRRELLDTDGTISVFPGDTSNKPPTVQVTAESGAPVEVTPTTSPEGDFNGADLQLLDFSGTANSTRDEVHVEAMWTGDAYDGDF